MENIVFHNRPYLVAYTNDYRDSNIFRNIKNSSGYTFTENELSYDAISLLTNEGYKKLTNTNLNKYKNLSSTGGYFSGDG